MLRLLYLFIPWLLYLSIQIPILLLGYITIPAMAALKRYEIRQSKFFNRKIVAWKDPLMYIWGNEEDGILNGWMYKDVGSNFNQIFYWSAMRNPTNNLRFIPFFSLKVDQAKVKFIGSKVNDIRDYDTNIPMWYLCWQGYQSSFRWQFMAFKKLWRFWIGWKVYPEDSLYPVRGHRLHGAGFGLQFKALDQNRITQ